MALTCASLGAPQLRVQPLPHAVDHLPRELELGVAHVRLLDGLGDVPGAVAKHFVAVSTALDKVEAFVSRLSVRDNFWHRICSFLWLPFAFYSGIRMKKIDANSFAAVLPFNRFNRNWYRAMAGGAGSSAVGALSLLGEASVTGSPVPFLSQAPVFSPMRWIIDVRQPSEFVAPEFTTWRDEQRAWREGIAFYDQSFHMTTTYLRGPDGVSHGNGLIVLTLRDTRICAMTRFETGVLPHFGLPRCLPSTRS